MAMGEGGDSGSGRGGSKALYPDSVHVRCAPGTGERVRRVAAASLTSVPEWLRRVVLDALERAGGGEAPSPLHPSDGLRARLEDGSALGGEEEVVDVHQRPRAYPEHVRVSCPGGTSDRIVDAAMKSGTSRSEWVRRALVRALDVYEVQRGRRQGKG